MTISEPRLTSAPLSGVAQPHQSTVDAILRAARQGLFTEVEAQQLIDRVRHHVTTFPLPTTPLPAIPLPTLPLPTTNRAVR